MLPDGIVKSQLNFPWRSQTHPELGRLVLEHCGGNVVDVGCGTCQVYRHLKANGWTGEYLGVDSVAYETHAYPEGVRLLTGDALTMELPKADTYILQDVLEHVEDPVSLLARCVCRAENVLIAVPKRNEDLWRYGIVEYHQLDKSHKHWGFTEEEVRGLVERSGGRISRYQELASTDLVALSGAFVEHPWFAPILHQLLKLFTAKSYAQEIWCEVRRRE